MFHIIQADSNNQTVPVSVVCHLVGPLAEQTTGQWDEWDINKSGQISTYDLLTH